MGYPNRTKSSCHKRWTNFLSGTDKSKMTKEEENIITKYYSQEVKFADLAKMMVNRTAAWVLNNYRVIFKDKINILKLHLPNQNPTLDEMCQLVKDYKLTIDDFKHVEEEDQTKIREILEFVIRDQHGQKYNKY